MYFDEDTYQTVRLAKLGSSELPEVLQQLRARIEKWYSVSVVHIGYSRGESRPDGRPRLSVAVESEADRVKLMRDLFSPKRHVARTIIRRFTQYVDEAEAQDEFDTERVNVSIGCFSWAAMERAAERFHDEHAKELSEECAHHNVWRIDGFAWRIVVFYHTDEDIRTNAANGSSDRIKWRCFELVKPYDEFDYFKWDEFQVEIDSKEHLDAAYEGSLFYYFR